MPVETLARRKESLYFELLPELKPVPEVVEHIFDQHGKIPLAVVSAARAIQYCLSHGSKIARPFRCARMRGEYRNSKPHPEAFCLPRRNWAFIQTPASFLRIRTWESKPRPLRE